MAGRSGATRRRSAAERRELVVEAAREEFAAFGLYGATGESISYRAGISHPYLLRLFGSKKELFLVVLERSFDELLAEARAAAEQAGNPLELPALEDALHRALGERQGFSALLQFFAACGDDEVRLTVRRRLAELYQYLERASSASEEEIKALFERLLLAAATATLRLSEVAGRQPWVRGLLGSP